MLLPHMMGEEFGRLNNTVHSPYKVSPSHQHRIAF